MRTVRTLSYILLALAPLGTRYIFSVGEVAGVPAEPGTVSVFATQFLVLAFAITALAASRRSLPWPGALPAAAFVLALFAASSSLWALDPRGSTVHAVYLALGALVLVGFMIARPVPVTAAKWLVGGAAVQAMFGFWQSFTQQVASSTLLGIAPHAAGDLGAFVVETASGRWLRAYGTLPHPNVYALYVTLGILCAVGLYLRAGSRKEHAFLVGTIAFLAAGMTLAFSRGAFLALMAGLAVLAWRTRVQGREVRKRLASAVLCVVLASVAVAGVQSDVTMTRLSGEGRLEDVSNTERQGQFGDSFLLFADHPFVGSGIGQMPAALSLRHPDGRDPYAYQYAHNIYVLIAVELGLVGLVLFLIMLGAWARELKKRGLASVEPAFLAGVAAVFAIGLVDHFPWSLWQGQLILWMVIGLSAYSRPQDA